METRELMQPKPDTVKLGQTFQLFKPTAEIESFKFPDRIVPDEESFLRSLNYSGCLESLFILDLMTKGIPMIPMIGTAVLDERNVLAINPLGGGYEITTEDVSYGARNKKLKDTAEKDSAKKNHGPPDALTLRIEAASSALALEKFNLYQMREQLFENGVFPIKPELIKTLRSLRVRINYEESSLEAEADDILLPSGEFIFKNFYPLGTGCLPSALSYQNFGLGNPLQIYSTDELLKIQVKFLLVNPVPVEKKG